MFPFLNTTFGVNGSSQYLRESRNFRTAVAADGGVVESLSHLDAEIRRLKSIGVYSKLSFHLTPVAYKAGVLYGMTNNGSIVPMTFSRGGGANATRVNAQGIIEAVPANTPRIDWSTGRPELLLEKESTNLLIYSSQYNISQWTKNDLSIIDNAGISPLGTMSASKIIPTVVSSSQHRLYNPHVSTVGASQVCSIYAKAAGYNYLTIQETNDTPTNVVFDLQNGTSSGSGTHGIIHIGNGWYRCYVVFTVTDTTSVVMQLKVFSALNQSAFSGDGISGILIWNAQSEIGLYPTSPIETTSSTVTRSAESIYKTGISSLLSDSEGTILYDGSIFNTETSFVRLSISDGTSNNLVSLGSNSGSFVGVSVVDGVTNPVLTGGIVTRYVNYKLAVPYSVSGSSLYVDSVETDSDNTDTSFPDSTFSVLRFSSSTGSSGNNMYGKTGQLSIMNQALTPIEIAAY